MKTYTQEELLRLRDQHEAWIMEQTGVTGTSIGLDAGGQIVLRIFTQGATEPTKQTVAKKLAGAPIAWEEGEIVAY